MYIYIYILYIYIYTYNNYIYLYTIIYNDYTKIRSITWFSQEKWGLNGATSHHPAPSKDLLLGKCQEHVESAFWSAAENHEIFSRLGSPWNQETFVYSCVECAQCSEFWTPPTSWEDPREEKWFFVWNTAISDTLVECIWAMGHFLRAFHIV